MYRSSFGSTFSNIVPWVHVKYFQDVENQERTMTQWLAEISRNPKGALEDWEAKETATAAPGDFGQQPLSINSDSDSASHQVLVNSSPSSASNQVLTNSDLCSPAIKFWSGLS